MQRVYGELTVILITFTEPNWRNWMRVLVTLKMVQEGLQAKKRSTAITQKIYFAENTLIRKIKSLNVG